MAPKKRFDVIALGSATKDIFIQTHESEVVKVKHYHTSDDMLAYPLGAKILVKDTHYMIGGGGANTAVSFSRQGLRTAYLGKLGNDSYQCDILSHLKKEKITFIGVIDKKAETNYSIVLNSKGDDRTILAHKDASDKLLFNELDKALLDAKWVYASSMMGKSFLTMGQIFRYAKKQQSCIAFNPSSYQVKMGKELYPLLRLVDVLIFNLEEACLLMKKNISLNSVFIRKLLESISRLGPRMVVITNGLDGAYAYDSSTGECVHAHGRKVKVKETTGAGDAFASSFIAGLLYHYDLPNALHYAMINAESVVENYGAHNILLSRKEIERRMKRLKRKIELF